MNEQILLGIGCAVVALGAVLVWSEVRKMHQLLKALCVFLVLYEPGVQTNDASRTNAIVGLLHEVGFAEGRPGGDRAQGA